MQPSCFILHTIFLFICCVFHVIPNVLCPIYCSFTHLWGEIYYQKWCQVTFLDLIFLFHQFECRMKMCLDLLMFLFMLLTFSFSFLGTIQDPSPQAIADGFLPVLTNEMHFPMKIRMIALFAR